MKKICFVKFDMQDASGAARVCANLSNELKDIYEVHVVSICSEKDTTFYPLDANVKYHVLMKGSGRIRDTLVKGRRLLNKYLKENEIDMVFGVGVSINPFIVFSTHGTKCQAITCEHLNCLSDSDSDPVQRFCRYLGAKFADKLVVLTKMDRDAYIEKYNLTPDKVVYIYNWVDNKLLSDTSEYDPKSKQLLTVVRVVPVKGIENIIEVSKRLKDNFPDWQWHIYGGGAPEYVQQLQNKIDENGLGDFVVLKGKVNDMYERYKDYGLFVLTSYCEGLPMVLIESKAKRVPCISFDCLTGPRDIIRDGEDGYLVPVDDIDTLQDKLELCMSDESLRRQLSENAYGNIAKFSKEEIIKKWINLIGD